MLASKIVPLIPIHNTYIEPFFGGGAVFFKKPPSKREVIVDTNRHLTNFYRVLQNPVNFEVLQHKLKYTPFSEVEHKDAKSFNKAFDFEENSVEDAHAFFVNIMQGFSRKENGSFALCKKNSEDGSNSRAKAFDNRKHLELQSKRLRTVEIYDRTAEWALEYFNTYDAFTYCDPPYINTECGGYKGYTVEDYIRLLDLLVNFKGKFILSSYPNEPAEAYANEHGWHCKEFKKRMTVGIQNQDVDRESVEVLWSNFQLQTQMSLPASTRKNT